MRMLHRDVMGKDGCMVQVEERRRKEMREWSDCVSMRRVVLSRRWDGWVYGNCWVGS
jgi:hypothetical protein